MAISNNYQRVLCTSICVDRENRQRRTIDTSGLKDSISLHGVLNPIIVREDLTLVAGERRLTASIELGLQDIPVRFYEDLSSGEAQIIELEENLKRADLNWKEEALAICALHKRFVEREPTWNLSRTAEALCISPQVISKNVKVGKAILAGHPKVLSSPGVDSASNVLSREEDRAIGDAISDIHEMTEKLFLPQPAAATGNKTSTNSGDLAGTSALSPPPSSALSTATLPILLEDFTSWATTYSGPKFNFIHCDFPYGISMDKGGAWAGGKTSTLYADSPDVYWALLECFCKNLDNFMAVSGHVMFWFSMHYYQETLDFFATHAPSLVFNPFPLIWLKSDNVGIMPDPLRGPRRIYETALMASREDRPVLKPVANGYAAPTDRQYHPSTKPEPMLKHFFQMFVDSATRMLDPTCGGGSALRAAEAMGAAQVLGLERDPEHHKSAISAMRKFRILRSA